MKMRMLNYGCIFTCIAFGLPFMSIAQQQLSQNRDSEREAEVDSTSFEFDAQTLTHQQLKYLPFRGESQEYYGLFSGTVVQDFRGTEFLHIRGSRYDEIGYIFENVNVRSAFSGLNMIRFIPEALEMITLNSSPSASLDNAVAVLQHHLRQGGSDFKLTLRGEADRFTSDYNTRFGTFSYGYYNYLLTSEGKILKDNMSFFVAGESEYFNDHNRKFWDGFSIGGPDFPLVDRDTEQTLQEAVDTDKIVVRSGNIPNANSERFTVNSIVTADYKPFALRVVGALNYQKQQQNDTPIRDIFNPERIPEFKQKAGLLSLQADYFGKKDLFAHVQLDLLRSNEKSVDPLFEDNFLLYRDSLAIVEKGVNWDSSHRSSSDRYIRGPGEFNFYQFHFGRPGELLVSYSKSEENYWELSVSVQKKLGNHQLNVGGSFQRRTLRRFAIGRSFYFMKRFREFGVDPDELHEDQFHTIRRSGDVRTFGYDVFGNKIEEADAISDAPKHPTEYSFYVEDRYRLKDLHMNIGLRYDSFSSDALVNVDPTNPEMFRVPGNPTSTIQTAPSHRYLSPRFRATFFANERLNFQYNFGKYVQQVRFHDVYASREYRLTSLTGGMFINDPRGLNAQPVRSSQTEMSVSYNLKPRLSLRTTFFYKTTDGLLEADRVITSPQASAADYNVLVNSGEAISKGMELSVEYNNKGFFTWINYTFSDVNGFTSYPISNLRDVELQDPNGFHSKSNPPSPLDFNQTHRGNALVSYEFSKHANPILRQTGLHLLFRFNSGHNFTLYEGDFG